MKKFVLLLLSIGSLLGRAQDKVQIHGFIKSDYWYDTRTVVYAREGLFTLYPAPPKYDADGVDINAQPSFNFSAITSRLTFKSPVTEAFGAKAFGYIEADFSGMSNQDINGFRLRHAYVKLSWAHTDLLLGQYWHPMFSNHVFPTVASLNTGAPFQPFIRSPQLRITLHRGNWQLIGTLLAQRDYSSPGPMGRSFSYLSRSLTPNAHLQLLHAGPSAHTFGLAADYKSISPYETFNNHLSHSLLHSYALMAYYQYKQGAWEWKNKVIAGQNMSEHLLLGGYFQSALSDTATGRLSFVATNHLFVWTNLICSFNIKQTELKAGVFAGYARNLGTQEKVGNIYYGSDPNLGALYRLSPSLSLKNKQLQFIMEFETTLMLYGHYNNMGHVEGAEPYTNHRLLFTTLYYF